MEVYTLPSYTPLLSYTYQGRGLGTRYFFQQPFYTSLLSQGDKGQLSAAIGCDPPPYRTSPASLRYRVHAPACMVQCALPSHASLGPKDDQEHTTGCMVPCARPRYTSLLA